MLLLIDILDQRNILQQSDSYINKRWARNVTLFDFSKACYFCLHLYQQARNYDLDH